MSKAKALIAPVVLAAAVLTLVWDVFDVSTGVRMGSAFLAGVAIKELYGLLRKG